MTFNRAPDIGFAELGRVFAGAQGDIDFAARRRVQAPPHRRIEYKSGAARASG